MCNPDLPLKYSEYLSGLPSSGLLINTVLKIKLLTTIPAAKITKAVYGVILPLAGLKKLSKSMPAAIKG
jgi:hypothetical protein